MDSSTLPNSIEDKLHAATRMPQPRPEFLAELRNQLMEEPRYPTAIPQTPRMMFRRPVWVIAIIILFLTAALFAIGPQRVLAAFRQLFGYIPGVGIVNQSAPIRVLAEPVSITRDGITITVTSATLTGDRTHIDYRIFGIPASAYPGREDVTGCMQQAYLRLVDGTQLAQMDIDFLPVPASINEAVLVIPCISNTLPGKVPVNWELPLHFIPAPPDFTVVPVIESLPSQTPSVGANTPTSEINPLTITKVLDIGDKFVLMGEFSHSAALGTSLPASSWWAIQQVSIIGADGREVPQSYSNDFQQPTPSQADSETWLYQLDKNFVPPVTITYTGEIISPIGTVEQAEFEFDTGPNPQDGSVWTVNKDFRLGGYNIRLVSIESSSRGYSFHFKADAGASANAISVDIVGYTPNCGGGGGGGDQFPVEFNLDVCYAGINGSPEFPHGQLKGVLNFQTLTRQIKTFQVQWSPDTTQTGPFATSTPQPGVCLASDTLAQLKPAPAGLVSGKALMYEQLVGTDHWGLILYNLDGSGKQVLASDASEGSFSPDGSQMAYPGTDGIHIIDLATKAEKVLAGVNAGGLRWSPDGKQIAYLGLIDSVFIVNADGTQVRQFSDLSYESIVGWSPDGTQLYFVVPYTGGAAWKVYSFDLASGSARELFTIENGTPKFLNPTLSLDGEWIAYRGRDNSSVYLVHPDGSGMHLVIDNSAAVGIEWSRSGWLGVSLRKANSDESMVVLIRPDGCEAYLLPALHGDLEGLSLP